MLIDYEILRIVWWALLGVLLIGFAIMDGFDLGIGILLPFLARTDLERRVVLKTIEPVWEGNQVWFVLGAGTAFAAWPLLYAASFSGFYLAMFLVLAALILRPVGFNFRNKVGNQTWRSVWDWALVLGGFVPALIFGVVFGNLLQGVPFHFDESLRTIYTGGFFGLLNPFALLCGLVSVAMLVMHGGVYAALKTEGVIAKRANQAADRAALALIFLFTIAGVWIAFGIDGYVITAGAAHDGPSNPLAKMVVQKPGAWMDNYGLHPWVVVAPLLGYTGALTAIYFLRSNKAGFAFIASATSIFGVIATAGFTMFPFIMPSSSDPNSSLTVWDSSSSQMTLFVMLICTAFFMPLIIAYTSWVFRVLRGKVTAEHLERDGPMY